MSGSSGARTERTVWDETRDPDLALYCDLLARGFAQLRFAPRGALACAERAEHLSPARATPALLRGRALAAIGDYAGAVAAFEAAGRRDPKILDEPGALHDLAVSLRRVGRLDDALDAYITLAPRAGLLPGIELRGRALVEGGEIALALGPRRLDDAIRLFYAARDAGAREGREEVDAALALALERKGEIDEARAILSEIAPAGDRGASGGMGTAFSPSALGASSAAPRSSEGGAEGATLHDPVYRQALAIRAMLDERLGRTRPALAGWQTYLAEAGADDPWRAHAEQHMLSLERRAPRAGAKLGAPGAAR